MSNIATAHEAAVASLLAQPTSIVASALRSGAAAVESITLSDTVRERVLDQLERATGSRAWSLEHLRDHRPLGEVLEIARLITEQRRTTPGRAQLSTAVPAVPRRPRQQPHVRVPGRAASGRR